MILGHWLVAWSGNPELRFRVVPEAPFSRVVIVFGIASRSLCQPDWLTESQLSITNVGDRDPYCSLLTAASQA